jgi:uncharacterized protein YjiS (DUF1127 family)
MLPTYSHEARAPAYERISKMLIAKLIRWFRAWSRYRKGLRELSQLDDRELADIGVTRSEIPEIAWQDAHH